MVSIRSNSTPAAPPRLPSVSPILQRRRTFMRFEAGPATTRSKHVAWGAEGTAAAADRVVAAAAVDRVGAEAAVQIVLGTRVIGVERLWFQAGSGNDHLTGG